VGVRGGQAMGECVGGRVGVGRRVIFVFFGVWKGKRGAGGFSRFSIFWRAGQVFVLVCVKKEAAPLMCVLVGGDGVWQGCLVSVVCGEHGHDACVGCGGRRGQDVDGTWSVRKRQRWRREEKGPVMCVPAP
jgi:hypothetical protein